MGGHERSGAAAYLADLAMSDLRIDAAQFKERNLAQAAITMVPGQEYDLQKKGFSG